MMQRRKGNKSSRRAGGRKPPREFISHPPSIGTYAIQHGVRLRFLTNAAVAQTISYQNLLDTILMSVTALSQVDVFHAVKIRKIEVWSMPAIGAASTVEVQLSGSTAGSQGSYRIVTDTSMGVQPAHVKVSPGRMTLASMYQPSSAATAFSIIAPTGSVVDVELSFKNDPGLSVAAQNASVGATIGSIGYRGLDGLAVATTKFTPAVAPSV